MSRQKQLEALCVENAKEISRIKAQLATQVELTRKKHEALVKLEYIEADGPSTNSFAYCPVCLGQIRKGGHDTYENTNLENECWLPKVIALPVSVEGREEAEEMKHEICGGTMTVVGTWCAPGFEASGDILKCQSCGDEKQVSSDGRVWHPFGSAAIRAERKRK